MKKKGQILVVDDEPEFVEACRMTFKSNSYKVITASSKEEAQDKMKLGADVVVLGTLAPAGQAFSVHQWLKQHPQLKDIPLLVIDAKYDERATKGWRKFEGMQLVAEEYVTKPIEPAALVPRIRSLLEEARRMLKILVADDHALVRDGISAVLALQKDIEVVAEAVNGKEAVEKVRRLLPDVTLMDIVMPVMNGLEATKLICRECPKTKVLILTQYDEKENVVAAKDMGAYGFIPKQAAGAELIAGIRSVAGGRYYPPAFNQQDVG